MGKYVKILNILMVVILFNQSIKCEDESEVVNDNINEIKNFVNKNIKSGFTRLLNENKYNKEVLKNIGKEKDIVNSYEDITILDDDGQLKNLKYKSVKPKIPVQLHNLVSHSDVVSESEKDNEGQKINNVATNMKKSKFFDELGCTYAVFFLSVLRTFIRF
ncbi:unnamed protein product [Euphydryas editha]|uniref:Fam-b protein n=1 Tax=Euphydryas editha TaxID=104508 RepID=A0AAU9TB88_EUPED|nr:unnamed protein product [Euphydryas editha]